MSTKTTNFEFIKPEKTDPADITSTNENWDKLDKALIKRDEDLSMGGHRITDVAEPTNGSDVATRHFVEQHSIEGNTYVAVDYNNDGNITLKPYVADEDELTFKSHIANKDNPHNVTLTQIQYKGMLNSTDDLNNVVENGVYIFMTNDAPLNSPYVNASVVEVFGSNSTTTQTIQRVTRYGAGGQSSWRALGGAGWGSWFRDMAVTELTDYPNCHYYMIGHEQEWISPPMDNNIEYRTTERHLGKPVYAKRIYVGKIDKNADEILLHHDLNIKVNNFVRGETVLKKDEYFVLPMISDTGTVIAKAQYGLNTVKIVCITDLGGYDGYSTIWYTKQ